MRIPESIKVGGIRYSVEVVDKIDESDAQGEINYEECRIRIKKGNADAMKQTFIHEMFHAINIDFDEERVEFLSVLFYQIVQDNPTIFGGEKHE